MMAAQLQEDGDVLEDKPVKVDKWDGNAVKNALDDAVRNVFTKRQSFEEDFKIMDGRLMISTISVAFSLVALGYDFLFPFPASKWVLAFCSFSYFVSVACLTLYLWFVEKGVFLVFRDGKNVWKATSTLKKYDDIYTLSLIRDNDSSLPQKNQEISRSVADFFDDKGNLHFDKFQNEVVKLYRGINQKKAN